MSVSKILYSFRFIRALIRLSIGALIYRKTGRTPYSAHQSLVQLFCMSKGRVSDWLSLWVTRLSPPTVLPDTRGLLGTLEQDLIDQYVDHLCDRGYLVFPKALPADVTDRLMTFAMTTPAKIRRMDNKHTSAQSEAILFNPAAPQAICYDYKQQDLLDNPDIQSMLADHSLLTLAQHYLGSLPRVDVLSMWWQTYYSSQPDSFAAQLYHFDMDRIKWLKVFIYLTDVGTTDGPHQFISGSHRTGGIPEPLLQKGYSRHTDDEVFAYYPREKEISFTAPKGTIIIEDTRGLHKGNPVMPDGTSRLVLQIQFSNSLFGAEPGTGKLSKIDNRYLVDMVRHYPDIYAQYL